MKAPEQHPASDKAPNALQTVGSVLAAAFGVQSGKNRERDFKRGKASTFIVAGIGLTVALILSLYVLVRLVLHQAGQ